MSSLRPITPSFRAPRAWMSAALLLTSSTVLAQTGVSDDRVSLPDGPGSRGGIGENVSTVGNMGLLTYNVAIPVPDGFPGLTPSVDLEYSSGAGQGFLGIGWTLDMPSIERMTARGLPSYVATDLFVADGGSELVEVPGSNPPTYRSRFEGSYVRYRWQQRADGKEGYWTAEYPDGRVSYYGARADGTLVANAREGSAAGTFRYLLVETVDTFDHKLVYTYTRDPGGASLLDTIAWAHDAGGTPSYTVTYRWEARTDELSDCKAGYDQRLTRRLAGVTVRKGTVVLRAANLEYEADATAGFSSRLRRVTQTGLQNTASPLTFTFEYSRVLGGVCTGAGCRSPFIVTLPGLGGPLSSGNATLLDINGDALPDILETPVGAGRHTFRVAQLDEAGNHTFGTATESSVTSASVLSVASTVVLDANGDGFTDMVNTRNGQVLYNYGLGDWMTAGTLSNVNVLPDLEMDAADGTRTVQFIDYDNDKRIDVIVASAGNPTAIYRNLGEAGFEAVAAVDNIGRGFDEGLQLQDMNGDGLMDPAAIVGGQLQFRLNLGFGKWTDWVTVPDISLSPTQAAQAELEDINGDGLTDVVVVAGNTVAYALNRNGETFAPLETLTASAMLDIPNRDSNTSVLFADMNGNGSTDVVWVLAGGAVKYLELFPVRPNLMSRVENGLGAVTDISYVTAVEQAASAQTPWVYRIPHSMLMVSRVDVYELNANLHDVTDYVYRDAWYDGVDKSFRGFERVQEIRGADETQEAGERFTRFDLGIQDRYRAGLLLEQQDSTGGNVVSRIERTWGECTVADAPTTGPRPVKHMCLQEETRELMEGRPAAEHVTVRTRYTYDGYGNTTRAQNEGVVAMGGGACPACTGAASEFGAPCGTMCLGDESYTDTTYVPPSGTGGRWMLRSPSSVKTYGTAGTTEYRETRTYYDGEAFTGLPLGQLTRGGVTRVAERESAADVFTDVNRLRLDSHGNDVEVLDALGMPGGNGHRALITYDDVGLRITRIEQHLQDATGPYQLRRDYQYDPTWDLPTEATSWMLVRGGSVVTARNSQFFLYDELSRVAAIVEPGDNIASPTEAYTYDSRSPVSTIRTLRRGTIGGAQDKEEVDCLDGLGRAFQVRTRVGGSTWVVRDHTVFNPSGAPVRSYQPWESTSADCESMPPAGVKFTSTRYDALDRAVETTQPDGEKVTTRHLPLGTETSDELDDDPAHPHRGTPDLRRRNGLGLVTSWQRRLSSTGNAAAFTYTYDQHGRLVSLRDPQGQSRTQAWDLRGRPVSATSPDEGTSTFTYDALGQRTARTDARMRTVRMEYDGIGRPTAVFEDGARATTEHVLQYDSHPDCPQGHCTNGAGRLVRVINPTHLGVTVRAWDHDVRGRIIGELHTMLGVTLESRYALDAQGALKKATLPGNLVLDYTLDAAERVTAVPGIIDGITRDGTEQITQLALANGTTLHLGHTDRLEWATQRLEKGSEILLQRTLARDARHRLTGITDTTPASAGAWSATYTRDAYGRLSAAAYGPAASPTESLAFTFDEAENILTASSNVSGSPANVGTYTVDGKRVTSAGGIAFEYDAGGFTTRRGADALAWDSLGRLSTVTRGSSVVGRYAYDAEGVRLLKEENGGVSLYVSRRLEIHDGVSTAYVGTGAGTVARVLSTSLMAQLYPDVAPASGTGSLTSAPDGSISAADAWLVHAAAEGLVTLGGGAPRLSATATLRAAAARLVVGTGTTEYLAPDERDSTLVITDSTGTVLGTADAYPFGALRTRSGMPAEAFLFTGKERDRTGYVYFGARYLDPVVGRWLSPDPLFLPMGATAFNAEPDEVLGTYAFVGNNPLDEVDPDGMRRRNKNKGTDASKNASSSSSSSSKGGGKGQKCGPSGCKVGKGPPSAPKGVPSPSVSSTSSSTTKTVSTKVSTKDLQAHEKLGGHAIQKHVGKTVEQLQSRLNAEKNISASSSYSSLESAASATSTVLGANESAVRNFLSGNSQKLVVSAAVPPSSGTVLRRDGTQVSPKTGVVVLRKDPASDSGFRIVTSYPSDKP